MNESGIYSSDFPQEYEDYNTQYKGRKETINWTLYDTVSYVSGTSTSLNFFNAIRANTSLGNMEVAGQLAAPKAFFLRAWRFYVKFRPRVTVSNSAGTVQTGVFDDLCQLINTGVLSFTVGSKLYCQFPLWVVTAGAGPQGIIAIVSSASGNATNGVISYAQNGIADPRAVFSLSKPLFIQPQINFVANLTWSSSVTLASGDTELQLVMDGDIIRPVQ